MIHDQACAESACGYCECILIAGVRTDEREQAKSLALAAYDRGYTVADNGGDPDATHVDALIAQTRRASSHFPDCPMRQCEHDRVWCEHECHCDTIAAVQRRHVEMAHVIDRAVIIEEVLADLRAKVGTLWSDEVQFYNTAVRDVLALIDEAAK